MSEIIDRSGGLLYSASTRSINIMRYGKDEKPQSLLDVDLQKFYAMGDKSSNPFLEGGDIIYVPTLSRTEVFQVNGEIGSEGEYEYKKEINFLLQLVLHKDFYVQLELIQ